MKKSRKLVLSVLLTVCAFCLCFALVGCSGGGDKDTVKYGYGEEGFYYYDGADSARYMLSLQSGTYMMTVNGAWAYSGSYSYDEDSGTVSFKGDYEFAAVLGDSALSLDMEEGGYSFKAYRFFDVTYVDENGKTIATESVLNGQSAVNLDIEKDGYWFIDWYIDSSNSAVYSFDTSIAGEATIYGWYIEKNTSVTEHTVTLDYGDGYTETMSTMNGTVYKELPTEYNGENILGWWVSATNKSGELTYKYVTGETFNADTTLFAVYSGMGASVTSAGITWDAANAGSSVSIEIKNSDGKTVISESSLSSTSGIYTSSAFTGLDSGVYAVEVTSGNITETRVYVVNGLSRVSLSEAGIIVNGSGRVLSFAPVDGADGYVITVTNGERTVAEDLGNHTYYNFSDWEMTKEGITFVVTAYGDGYVESESNAYTYVRVLSDVTLSISDDVVSWSRVEGALEYVVTITGVDGNVVDSFRTSDTSFSLKYYGSGTYDITVQPHTDGYYSEATPYYGYAKDSLMAPQITDVTNYEVSWTEIEGADSYVVLINGAEYAIEDTKLIFSTSNVPTTASSYEISVKAVKNGGSDSPYSNVIIATEEFSSAVSYDKNRIYWNYDIAAAYYGISVNGADETKTEGGNSFNVTLTKAGDNVITVTAYDENAVSLGSAEITVYAYSVILDPNGAKFADGTENSDVIYVAQGDELNLGTVEKDYADFVGWYTQADYTGGQSDTYEGKGSLVGNGSIFTGNGSMYLYAYWTYQYIDVALDAGSGTLVGEDGNEITSVRIKYNSTAYVLPVPAAASETDDFTGWYSEDEGNGERYTNETGSASGTPYGTTETLYARYVTTRSYSRTTYNGETVYAVTATKEAGTLTEMTVPEHYTVSGTAYGIVLNSNAFENCTALKVLNIPDTVLYISLANDGYRSGTGAFADCSALEEVNIYITGNAVEPMYFSENGVLFHKITSSEEGDTELIYYPYAKKTASYVIPSIVRNDTECENSGVEHAVTTIPTLVFRDRYFVTVTVPATVTYVASQAFYNNASLTAVVFEEGGYAGLVISDTAFGACTALKSVVLPARYTGFNVDAFTDCGALTSVTIEDGGVYKSENGILLSSDGSALVYFPIGLGGDIDISALASGTITTVGDKAFYGNRKVTSITIPASVSEIGESAFEGCRSVSSVVFEGTANSSALSIGARAFYGCTLLERLTLPVNLVALGENAFGNCSSLKSVYFDTATPNVTLDFAENAFGASNYITTLELGDNVPGIENLVGVFDGGNLQKIIVSESNPNYYTDEVGALYNDDGTRILYYPRGAAGDYTLDSRATTVPYGVFTDRVNLTSVTIGASVNMIEDGAFDGCTYLEKITVDSSNVTYGSDGNGILYGKAKGEDDDTYVLSELILCPPKCVVTSVTASETVTKVSGYAFANNASITEVEFKAETSFELGSYAFYNCENLETVTLPDCMTSIPAYAFYGCEKLASVSIPENITCIGDYAFYHCYLLTGDLTDSENGIKLPEGLVEIGKHAFDIYDSTPTFTPLDDSSRGSVGSGSLVGGDDSGSDSDSDDPCLAVTIPASVTSIGDYAFQGCWNAEGASVAIVFASASDGSATEPDLTIGSYAFAYTQYASKVEIPARVTSVGTYAFYYFGCKYGTTESDSDSGGGRPGLNPLADLSGTDDEDDGSTPVTFEAGSQLTTLSASVFEHAEKLKTVEIPATVTSLDACAFYYCKGLEEITFGEGTQLSSIGNNAFAYTVLKSICIPAGVTSIGYYAFRGNNCDNLTEGLTFEEDSQLETIDRQAFYNSGVTEVALPASLTSINYSAFEGCTSLTKVSFQGEGEVSGLSEIGYSCFKGCTALTDVELPKNLIKTGSGTSSNGIFNGCTALIEITIPASVTTIMAKTFTGCTSLATINFEEGCSLETIGDGAFTNCTSLKSFTFPESVATSIALGSEIFSGCALETLTLSSGVTDIGEAFIGSTIAKIEITENTTFEVDCTGKVLYSVGGGTIAYIIGELEGEYKIPDGVTVIGSAAFAGQTKMTAVEIGAQVASIGEYAFYGCTSLAKVTIADGSAISGDAIGEYAFSGCEKLENIGIPDGVTILSEGCFYGCSVLASLTLPSSVTEIGAYALYKTGVTQIDLTCIETVGSHAFDGASSLASVTVTDTTTNIGTYAFQSTAIVAFDLPNTITSVSNYMFCGCASLTSIEIPEGVTSIGSNVFSGCTALANVKLPSTLVSLGQYAFQNCSSLVTCDLPASLEEIGTYAFYGCSSLESIVFPEKLTQILNNTFYGCESLKGVDFGDNITSIGINAFYGCTSLETVIVGRYVTYLGQYAFYGCTSLTYAYTGDLVSSLDQFTFANCSSLETIEFGTALKSIGMSVFQNCTSLVTVTLNVGLEEINASAFAKCTGLQTMYIPSTLSYVAYQGFTGCSCDLYIENSYNYVSTYWDTENGWDNGFAGTAYYYSQVEPGFTAAGDAYDGNYWYYDDDNQITVWEFAYATYATGDGGYVLCPRDGGTVSYVCLVDEDGTAAVYKVAECASTTEGYTVTLKDGDSYTVVLTDTEGTLTATVAVATD
ncbi:MAG: leucine-rich repeat domain-containing protein [Bacteroidales bacterium]|nr:leucine-rich repeat domain-containing protein [Bacteroidales bacterium]